MSEKNEKKPTVRMLKNVSGLDTLMGKLKEVIENHEPQEGEWIPVGYSLNVIAAHPDHDTTRIYNASLILPPDEPGEYPFAVNANSIGWSLVRCVTDNFQIAIDDAVSAADEDEAWGKEEGDA